MTCQSPTQICCAMQTAVIRQCVWIGVMVCVMSHTMQATPLSRWRTNGDACSLASLIPCACTVPSSFLSIIMQFSVAPRSARERSFFVCVLTRCVKTSANGLALFELKYFVVDDFRHVLSKLFSQHGWCDTDTCVLTRLCHT